MIGGSVLDRGDGSQGQDAVEAKGLVDETSDIAEIIAQLGVVRVLCPVGGGSDDDSLGVGIYIELLVSRPVGKRTGTEVKTYHPQAWSVHRGC